MFRPLVLPGLRVELLIFFLILWLQVLGLAVVCHL